MTFIENYLIGAGVATYGLLFLVVLYWIIKDLIKS